MQNVNYIVTSEKISLLYKENEQQLKRAEFYKDTPEYPKLLQAIKANDENEVFNIISGKKQKIEDFVKGKFHVRNDNRIYHKETNTYIGSFLSKTILEWQEQNLPVTPLINFHLNVLKNPNADSVEDLYEFLSRNHFPITEDGCFLGYKKVRTINNGLYDDYTGKIKNDVGTIVKMARDKCDKDRRNECSYGLHVGAWDYVRQFSGDTIIIVKVNPEDCISVPLDYNRQKMRCCGYEVMSIYKESSSYKEKYIKTSKEEENLQQDSNELPSYVSYTIGQWKEWAKNNLGIDIVGTKKNLVYEKIKKQYLEQQKSKEKDLPLYEENTISQLKEWAYNTFGVKIELTKKKGVYAAILKLINPSKK